MVDYFPDSEQLEKQKMRLASMIDAVLLEQFPGNSAYQTCRFCDYKVLCEEKEIKMLSSLQTRGGDWSSRQRDVCVRAANALEKQIVRSASYSFYYDIAFTRRKSSVRIASSPSVFVIL